MSRLYDQTRVSLVLCMGWLSAQVIVVIFGMEVLTLTTAVIVTLLLLFLFITIFSMRVVVTRDDVSISFGVGLISRRVPLERIQGCEVVNNAYLTWLYDPMQEHVLRVKIRGERDLVLGIGDPKRLSEIINTQRR